MAVNTLIIDLSDEFISLAAGEEFYLTDISSKSFWEDPLETYQDFNDFLALKNIKEVKTALFTLPVKALAYQVVTLPENIEEKEQKILLGLEIEKNKFPDSRFSFKKLELTKREEDGTPLCDYFIVGPKKSSYKQLLNFAKQFNCKEIQAVPSYNLFKPNGDERLSATALVTTNFTEITIWAADDAISIAHIPSSGDQMEDINRYLSEYFNQVENVELANVRLYGSKMQDASLVFSLNYPNQILDNPRVAVASALNKAKHEKNILEKTQLPRPPIAMNARNISFLAAAGLLALVFIFTSYVSADNMRLKSQLSVLRRKASSTKKIYAQAKKLENDKRSLDNEKSFYLNITKRRTPWHHIFYELSDLTPRNLWLERFSGNKMNLNFAGKAENPEQVSMFSINLNNNSQYFFDAQIMGTRDYKEGENTYSEFQLSAKLKSPSGEFIER